ncbi:MAG: uroporphyrinogen decarboxylase family protein [Oscillospiraceae bacterium]
MTVRERFHATMNADPAADCCPVMEWASWWDKTVHFWEEEGLPKGLTSQELFRYFGLDPHYQFWFPTKLPNCPKPVSHGAPIITDESDYKAIRHLLLPEDAVERMLPQIEAALPQYESGEALAWYTLEGFFWFPRELFGIEGHLYSFYDEPELYHRICSDLLEWQLKVVEDLSRYLKPDFMSIAEDMSYNHGPMISEELFEEFIAPYYKQLTAAIKKQSTRVIVDSDGDISVSVPWFIRSGVEGILPLEKQAGVDIGALQQEYPDFLWLGGFDKMCLLKDREAIDAEFARILPMLRRGRFVPSVDHQTPPGVSMENYRYYIDRLRHFGVQACKDAAL